MKFKIDDKVKVVGRDDMYVPEMEYFEGREGVVVYVGSFGRLEAARVEIEGRRWLYRESSLELVQEELPMLSLEERLDDLQKQIDDLRAKLESSEKDESEINRLPIKEYPCI